MTEKLPISIDYHGYQIRPLPRKVLVESVTRWNTQFEIWEHKGSVLTVFPFCDKLTFDVKKDAVKRCFSAGKYIIDNKPGCLIKHDQE